MPSYYNLQELRPGINDDNALIKIEKKEIELNKWISIIKEFADKLDDKTNESTFFQKEFIEADQNYRGFEVINKRLEEKIDELEDIEKDLENKIKELEGKLNG